MDKELFKTILEKFIKFEEFTDALQVIGIDIVETPGFETPAYLFDRLLESYFTEEGCNWITWYMFEKRLDPDNIQAFDDNGVEICKDIDGLWEEVKKHLK